MKTLSLKRMAGIGMLVLGLTIMPTQKSHAVIWVVVKAALIKVIKALDLQVQRLQNKTIWLQNAQKSLENTMSKLQLDEINDWVSKNKEQYSQYFDELKKIKGAIDTYRQVREILQKQISLVKEYKIAYSNFRSSGKFSAQELAYMMSVYEGMVSESLRNIDYLFLAVKPGKTQMTDGGRLSIIAAVAGNIDDNLNDLKLFNFENSNLGLSRTKSLQELQNLKKMWGLH